MTADRPTSHSTADLDLALFLVKSKGQVKTVSVRQAPPPERTGLAPHYKVRVSCSQALYLASWTEPKVELDESGETILSVKADWIDDPAYAYTVGYIDWPKVMAITWRWNAGKATAPARETYAAVEASSAVGSHLISGTRKVKSRRRRNAAC